MFNSLHSKTYSKSTSVIKVATMKNTANIRYTKEAITKSTFFAVSKDQKSQRRTL